MNDNGNSNGAAPPDGPIDIDATAFDDAMIADFSKLDGDEAEVDLNRRLWDRRDEETKKSFEAFTAYLKLGSGRSLAKLGRSLGKTKTHLEKWSAQHDWVRRAEAFDVEQDRLYFLELKQARRDMAQKQAEQARSFQAVAMKALEVKFGAELEKVIDGTSKMTPTEILRFMIEASKMERIALGEPGDIIEEQMTGGISDDTDRKPVIPLTFGGRIKQALDLLETARTRASIEGAEQSN